MIVATSFDPNLHACYLTDHAVQRLKQRVPKLAHCTDRHAERIITGLFYNPYEVVEAVVLGQYFLYCRYQDLMPGVVLFVRPMREAPEVFVVATVLTPLEARRAGAHP